MAGPSTLSDAELAALTDPADLIERAQALELAARAAERTAALDRLAELIAAGRMPPAPPERSWALELKAEQAIDAPVNAVLLGTDLLEETIALADGVLRDAEPRHERARARATLARGKALAWIGTAQATRQADAALAEAAARFGALGHTEWHGYAVCWRGHAIHFLSGDLPRAAASMAHALELLGPDSPQRPTVLSFYAETLIALGDWDGAERALAEGDALAARAEHRKARSYQAWSRARLHSARGDGPGTERLLRAVERDWGDWGESHGGGAFELDAAEMLDRLGLVAQAEGYLARAAARGPDVEDWVRRSRATMMARSGDPFRGIDELQHLARDDWLERRLLWRHTLLTAWATFRAGREGAGALTARALEQAVECGGVRVAQAGEPELVAALAPLAEQAGSPLARELLLAGRGVLVRLFGTPVAVRADGSTIELPPGRRSELVRMLAIAERGRPIHVVLAALFPGTPEASARHRLRQLLFSLRSVAGELVVRDGEVLRLVPAWVDVREFLAAADVARRVRGPGGIRLAYAALARCGGPLLPTDPYAAWTEELRSAVEERHLALLDAIATDAAARGSHQEALTALDAALEYDPEDPRRRAARAREQHALGSPGDDGPAARAHEPGVAHAPGHTARQELTARRTSDVALDAALREADARIAVGEWEAAERILAGAMELAPAGGDPVAIAHVTWSLAHVASGRGDALATERLLREVERGGGEGFAATAGTAFLADAAEQLDRLGLIAEAGLYLERALARGAGDPAARRALATLLARSGDPDRALAALAELPPGPGAGQLAPWRHTLLTAWAQLRGGLPDAGELAARALGQAVAAGGLHLASSAEPELVFALLPLAERAGSSEARAQLLAGRPLLVRLFGEPRATRADGSPVALPAGMPGALVRMLGLHEHGLPLDVVLEAFFPDASASSARHRLRQVLTRMRGASGELVVRDGDHLRLIPAWVDVHAFLAAARRVRGLSGARAVRLAHAALAHHTGPLLPSDGDAAWAADARGEVEYRHAALCELLAGGPPAYPAVLTSPR